MDQRKTIAAISTAQGAGGIGVIRISGEEALAVGDRVFRSAGGKKLSQLKGYTALYGRVFQDGEAVDEAVALVFRCPHSYTGEDVVEFSCHGGLYLTRQVLRAVLDAGAVPAQPGEFTKRAFLNGKMGLTEAESVMDMISAKGRQGARAALAARDGAVRRAIVKVKDSLVFTAAHLSAWADYPEEDIPQVEEDALLSDLNQAEKELMELLRRYDAGKAIREGLDTVIAGRPNVGKSTLMNLLSGCQRSIVTEIPGTTRDIVEETVLVGEITLRLSDTAGLRSTRDLVEQIGVDRAKSRVGTADLVLAVFDASQKLNQDDRDLLDSLEGIPAIGIINKTDLESKIDVEYIKRKIKRIVFLAASQGTGLEDLEKALEEISGAENLDPAQGILATERQQQAAKEALACVREAKEALHGGMTLDAVTVSIEGAVQALLELTGERASEAVVDQVFHRFCVGK